MALDVLNTPTSYDPTDTILEASPYPQKYEVLIGYVQARGDRFIAIRPLARADLPDDPR
jgi:hypothetical protein